MNPWIDCFTALKKCGELEFQFGIEREGLRVTNKGKLAMTPHPESFGDKLTNTHITTDFSESQIEIITEVGENACAAVQALRELTEQVNAQLPTDEFLWCYSMPCEIEDGQLIPVAQYADNEKGREATAYRRMLAEKYGAKKQLLSGIHLNFSFSEATLEAFRFRLTPYYSLKIFKNQLYLKITRQLLRYRWLIIYLTGCSPICDQSFFSDADAAEKDIFKNSISLRNSGFGYSNKETLFPSYVSVGTYVESLEKFIREGSIAAPKELYASVRMKPKDPEDLINSLKNDGIQYLELRMIDLNVFETCAIAEEDMIFIQNLILYLLTEQESDFGDWQAEAQQNAQKIAECGLDSDLVLSRNGDNVLLTVWATQIVEAVINLNYQCALGDEAVLESIKERIRHPEQLYASRIKKQIESQGYTATLLDKAKNNKHISIES